MIVQDHGNCAKQTSMPYLLRVHAGMPILSISHGLDTLNPSPQCEFLQRRMVSLQRFHIKNLGAEAMWKLV